jgi:hypothetical protein
VVATLRRAPDGFIAFEPAGVLGAPALFIAGPVPGAPLVPLVAAPALVLVPPAPLAGALWRPLRPVFPALCPLLAGAT